MPFSRVMERTWSYRIVNQVSPPPTRMRSIRAEWMSGTSAASLTQPIRCPLTSQTGMASNSVKNRKLSAIQYAPARGHRARIGTAFDLVTIRSTRLSDAYSQYGSPRAQQARKKWNQSPIRAASDLPGLLRLNSVEWVRLKK